MVRDLPHSTFGSLPPVGQPSAKDSLLDSDEHERGGQRSADTRTKGGPHHLVVGMSAVRDFQGSIVPYSLF